MSAFDQVIGYEAIKNELMQICDMVKNKEVYDEMGASLPHGLLLYGNPGLGKSLMAKCLIEETGLLVFALRRNKGGEGFLEEISRIFEEAKKNTPCIIFLDDMDKFANEDDAHRDAEEYVAIQAGIDDVKDSDVFVVATVNDMFKLPDSLVREGRFDRKIDFYRPSDVDSEKIVRYFLRDKKVSSEIDYGDLCKMMSYSSCAQLETILNEAAIHAAYERKRQIEMSDLIHAVLNKEYQSAEDNQAELTDTELKKIALHEAGHLVISEVLVPGSVGLASVRNRSNLEINGFVHRCKSLGRRPHQVLVSLGGKAAVEMYYAETFASGCHSDISNAVRLLKNGITENATKGYSLLNVSDRATSQAIGTKERSEAVIYAELESYEMKARDILLKNRQFLEEVAAALAEKKILLYSDIQGIKSRVPVTEMIV